MYLNKEPLYGNYKSKFILIKDTNNVCGTTVLKAIMNLFCKERTNLALLCYEGCADDLCYGLNIDQEKLQVFDILSDPLGWDNSNEVHENLLSVDFIEDKFANFKGALVIYSLSSLLIHNGIDQTYKILHKLMNINNDLQILSLLHTDIQDTSENCIMDKLASTVLQMNPDENKNTLYSTIHYASGKVTSLLLDFNITQDFQFKSLTDVNVQIRKAQVKQPDPTANLTFNLRLNEQEKEARGQVQLPYMKVQSSDEAIIQNLLENDFYDEEDPDDDLDI